MKGKFYIILFAILYITTATISTFHAISFFGLANSSWMSVVLACTFEIGQAAVLFSLLNSSKERTKIMPWTLMCILTLVQIMGNVFSSYKYLMLNSSTDMQYFTEPIMFFMEPGDPMAKIILTYIIGAILPIVALCMTGMVSNWLEEQRKLKEEPVKEISDKPEEELVEELEEVTEKSEEEPVEVPEETEEIQEVTEDSGNKLKEVIFR